MKTRKDEHAYDYCHDCLTDTRHGDTCKCGCHPNPPHTPGQMATWKYFGCVMTGPKEVVQEVLDKMNAHTDLLEALETAYKFFNTEANTPDKDGYTVAPDSMVRVILRKMNQAIQRAEKGE